MYKWNKKDFVIFIISTLAIMPLNSMVYAIGARRIKVSDYIDKVKAAWVGKMVGVSWGSSTEFKYRHETIPDDKVPVWTPGMINEGYDQDDLYLSIGAMKILDDRGWNVPPRQIAIDEYNFDYEYWQYFNNNVLAKGYAPPDSGHPFLRLRPDGNSYMCGAEFSGIIAPGQPNIPIQLADKFGQIVAYGDGIYGGAFIGAMYSEAFFEKDVIKIIQAGLKAIPSDSWFAQAINDTIMWKDQNPTDWKTTWNNVMKKYFWDSDYNWIDWPSGGRTEGINFDNKLNAAFIVMGLLYGNNDPDQSIKIAMQCGADSDCNPADVGGILFETIGYNNLDAKYISDLKKNVLFKYMPYNFEQVIQLTEKLSRVVIQISGGKIEFYNGEEYFVIPSSAQIAIPPLYINSKYPNAVSNSFFTQSEKEQMRIIDDSGFENQKKSKLSGEWFVTKTGTGTVGVDRYLNTRSRTGTNNAWISTKDNSRTDINQTVKVEINTNYRLSCFIKNSGNISADKGYLSIKTLDGNIVNETTFGSSTEWIPIIVDFNSGNNTKLTISAGYCGEGISSWCRFDDFSIVRNNSYKE